MANHTLQKRASKISANTDDFVLEELGRFQAEIAGRQRVGGLLDNWRKQILEYKGNLGSLANAIRDVISARGIDVCDSAWAEVYQLAEETETTQPKNLKLRYLGSIVALWGTELVEHYGLKSQGERQLRALRACAIKDPNFHWFPELANMIMLRRHEHSLVNNRTASIALDVEKSRLPLKLEDLNILAKFASGKLEFDGMYERVLTSSSDKDCQEIQRVNAWASCVDGTVAVAGLPLRYRYPKHYANYLLKKDRFGIFVPLSAQSITKKRSCDQSLEQPRFPNLKRRSPGVREPLSSLSSDPSHLSPPAKFSDSTSSRPSNAAHSQNFTQSPKETTIPGPRPASPENRSSTSRHVSPTNRSRDIHDVREAPSYDLSQESEQRSKDDMHSNSLFFEMNQCRQNAASELNQEGCSLRTIHVHRQMDKSLGQPARRKLTSPDKNCSFRSGDLPGSGTNSQENTSPNRQANTVTEIMPEPSTSQAEVVTEVVASARQCAGYRLQANICQKSTEQLPETQRNDDDVHEFIHPSDISVDATHMLAQWNRVIHETARGAPHPVLDEWINPVRFASMFHAQSPENYHEMSHQSYDVVELSSETLRTLIQQDTIFSKPLIIKEEFADSGDHTLPAYTETLARTFPGGFLNVRCHQGAPERTPLATVLAMMHSDNGDPWPKGPNLLDLADLSNAIKPGLTRVPRLRLLDYISQNAKALATDRYGKQEALTPFDVGNSHSFEIYGFRGAFSGAHLDMIGGTWLRNLFGVKSWMFIPESLMTDADWSDFARDGPEWSPKDKSRAVILRPGDVFVMPPGIRVIHAVQTLETCLMNGGMFWDERTILPTLHAIRWICQNQAATNEPIPYQLNDILSQLETLVDSYLTMQPWCVGASEIKRAMSDIRAMGCHCKRRRRACDGKTCRCHLEGRRCTPMCNAHPMLDHMPLCMVDPVEGPVDGGGDDDDDDDDDQGSERSGGSKQDDTDDLNDDDRDDSGDFISS